MTFINDPVEKTKCLINPYVTGTRFIVCGGSGSGKARSIELANSKFPEGQRIAESRLLTKTKDAEKALASFEDDTLVYGAPTDDSGYETFPHIGFCVIYSRIAKEFEDRGVKVFWLDCGITDSR